MSVAGEASNRHMHVRLPFKLRKSFRDRREEVAEMRTKFPNKVPVIVERYHKERELPPLDKTKFLVPKDLPMSHLVAAIRSRMSLDEKQTFYIIINNKSIASMTTPMTVLYEQEKDVDGFLYMTYASQDMFG